MTARRVIAFIFARGGSKGLPGKNARVLGDRPLVAHAIETAGKLKSVETVIVSTDNSQIADIAREYGAETPFVRPAELAADDAPEWKAWQHAVEWTIQNRGPFDTFLSLPPTSPLRNVRDVEACLTLLHADSTTDMVITGSKSERSPYFNMVEISEDGIAQLAITGSPVSHRQQTPELFDIATVAYAARPAFVLGTSHMFNGRVRLVEVSRESAIDIDTSLDFQLAEYLWQKRTENDNC